MSKSPFTPHPLLLAGAAWLVVGGFGPAETAFGQNTRKDIKTLKASDQPLMSYSKAIAAMKALPATDVHNWTFQANMHGFPSTPCPDPLWGQCQHGHWWFQPWHRAYLYYFEKIVQKQSGDTTFALPYWNWNDTAERTLPAPFQDKTSQFYDATRAAGVNDGSLSLDPQWVVTDFNTAMATTAFSTLKGNPLTTFGGLQVAGPGHFLQTFGALESSPHNNVHDWFVGNMADPNLAARDPIFFLHHSNIDRLWVNWLAQAGGRANPTDAAWLNQTFSFYDENKAKVTIAVKDLLDTKTLGYVYNHAPEKSNAKGGKAVEIEPVTIGSAKLKAPLNLGKERVTVTVKLSEAGSEKLKALLAAPKRGLSAITLRLEGVTYSTEHGDSSIVAYINLPKDAKLKKGHNPDGDNPYYAYTFSPFGPVKDAALSLNVTKAIETVSKLESWKPGEVRVTLVRHWFGGAPAEVKTQLTIKGVKLRVNE